MLRFKILLFLFFSISSYSQVYDIDGNEYNVIQIGNQEWLKENLKVTHFNDGIPIRTEVDSLKWIDLDIAAYCWYKNDKNSYEEYGALYNRYAADDSRLCPYGWKVPSKEDFFELVEFLDPETFKDTSYMISEKAGEMLKLSGYDHWPEYEDINGSNSSGFSALPTGCRGWSGWYNAWPEFGYLWGRDTWTLSLRYATNSVFSRDSIADYVALGVRCIRDATTDIDTAEYYFIKVYPNPITEYLNISYFGFEKLNIKIFNEIKLVYEGELFNNRSMIDLSTFSSGFYYIMFYEDSSKEVIQIEKIIKI